MSDAAKENWIEHYIFMGGQQWGDPPPTREEVERAWGERRPVIEMIPPGPYVEPRLDPRPATPQPPEWIIDPVPQALLDLAEMERKARQEVCGITDLMRGVSQPSDRALSDFTARRKAKRENGIAEFDNSGPHWACEHCGLLVKANDAAYSAHESACDARIIARAMSTPLPHDPDIRTRLMPWRNK